MLQQVRHRADVVFVGMGNQQSPQTLADVEKVAEVGDD